MVAMLVVLVGCAVDVPELPEVQLVMWPGQPELAEYQDGACAWEPLGFAVVGGSQRDECPRRWYSNPRETDCVITIGIKRESMLVEREGTTALSNRAERYIVIDDRVTNPYDLTLAVAHEAGHILLDTAEHTQGGVMGGSSTQLDQVDYELACAAIGVCL